MLVIFTVANFNFISGITGTVFCIGGSPSEIQAVFEDKLKNFNTNEELQNGVLRHIFSLISSEITDDLNRVLGKNISWEEKVALSVHLMSGKIMYSNQYAKELIKASYERIVQARKYNSEPRQLRSKIISLRPSLLSPYNDYNDNNVPVLQNYSLQKVIQYQLDSPFAFAAYNLQCSAIINRHLDDDILEAFNNKNLCETYILNADSFMTNANTPNASEEY